jgi:hypothetical protein
MSRDARNTPTASASSMLDRTRKDRQRTFVLCRSRKAKVVA